MNYSNMVFAFFLILCALPFNHPLQSEEIVGGFKTHESNFKYQVAIMGRHNNSHQRLLLCNGGILSNFYLLGYCPCFLTANSKLRKMRFYAIVGLVTLQHEANSVMEIVNIYTHTKNCISSRRDVAVLEMRDSLNLEHPDSILKSLKLPSKYEVFEGRQASVAGYGATSLNKRVKATITSNSTHRLMYAFPDISTKQDCQRSYPLHLVSREMCGVIKPNSHFQHRGLCMYDEGAPLVVDEKVVGVALKTRQDCNDTVEGGLYAKITFYLDFINGVMTGNPKTDTVVHPNNIQIVPSRMQSLN